MLVNWINNKVDELRLASGKFDYFLIYLVIGIALVTVHLNFLGYTWGFGIIVGSLFILAGTLGLLLTKRKEISLPSKWLSIPVGLILLSSLVRVFLGFHSSDIVGFGTIVILVLLTFVARVTGRKVFWLLIPLALQLSVASVIDGLKPSSEALLAGGIGLTGNSGLAGTILAFSLLFLEGKWKWLSIPILIGIFFAADHWSIIAIIAVAIIMFFRKDGYFSKQVSRRLIIGVVATGLILVVALWPSGLTQRLYGFTKADTPGAVEFSPAVRVTSLNGRLPLDLEALKNTKILGNGIQIDTANDEPTEFNPKTRYGGLVHFVPLMILDDLGPVAAAAWITLVIYCIWRLKTYRYQFIFIFVASLFSYWFWTPTALGIWFFALVGVASREGGRNEKILEKTTLVG